MRCRHTSGGNVCRGTQKGSLFSVLRPLALNGNASAFIPTLHLCFAGKGLPTYMLFVLEVPLDKRRTIYERPQHFREGQVLVQALHEELGMPMQNACGLS